jgi:hypothetical protein
VEVLSLHYGYELDAHGGWVRTMRQRYRLLTEEGVSERGVVEAPWQPWYLEEHNTREYKEGDPRWGD